MDFATAYELQIGQHVEKKGKFSYLSWAYAVRYLRENLPDATWTIHENANGLPIFSTVSGGHMVKVSVHIADKTYTQWHPILNNQNKPILEPSTFDINTSIHRCLTKAIAIATGIGLGLYAGEDLPKEEGEEDVPLFNSEKHESAFSDSTVKGWQGLVDSDKEIKTFWDRYEADVIKDLGDKKAKMVKAYWESKAIK